MANILIVNGPNLNLLGAREPERYGHATLESLEKRLNTVAKELTHHLHFCQSNSEGDLVDIIQKASKEDVKFIIINPAAFTHTSVAIRDALLAVSIPFIEVHISNIYKREAFRHHSYFSDIALGVISGLGTYGYELALGAAHQYLSLASSKK